ncbi:MAG: membrane integrity-associated transporter subunit PqiC [Kiritimatiellia bacterium]|nr:PqiC family protein [Lentisphaerota bacterium]
MKKSSQMRGMFLLLGMTVFMLITGGCASTREARFFILPVDPADVRLSRDAAPAQFNVRLLLPRIPAYLDRPQLVTRLSQYEVRGSEFHRWGMPLDKGVARFLSARLGAELPEACVQMGTGATAVKPTDYTLLVELVTLDGKLGGDIDLVAEWTLFGADNRAEPLVRRLELYRQPVAGVDYDNYVAALAEALGRLATDLAAAIRAQLAKD